MAVLAVSIQLSVVGVCACVQQRFSLKGNDKLLSFIPIISVFLYYAGLFWGIAGHTPKQAFLGMTCIIHYSFQQDFSSHLLLSLTVSSCCGLSHRVASKTKQRANMQPQG